ncbi:MAG: glycosyltransferase family 2 protein [Anaerolineae bacterium]|nr:glycosyltransferase family 2 protein [Anaerolineae bacterium]
MHVAIIIPALNEAGNIARLIAALPDSVSPRSVIVVDNGSTDGTADEARSAGALVVAEPRRGYGYACAAGVAAAGDGVDVLVFLDGDGSFAPDELPRLLAPIVRGEADLVLGSRPLGGIDRDAMPPQQRFGNWLVSRLVRLRFGVKISDLGPYRAVRRTVLQGITMQEMTYGYPTEMIVKLARRARIVEAPVSYRKRWSGRSKVSGTLRGTLLAAYYILGAVIRYGRG